MDWESLLGGLLTDRTRRCEIMFPEGETTTLGFDCEGVCFAAFLELVDPVGETSLASVGVGGVMKVVGASDRLGGVAGNCVMILVGATARLDGLADVSPPASIGGGDACKGSSNTRASRFFPVNSPANRASVFSL